MSDGTQRAPTLAQIADQVPLGFECRSCGASAYNWLLPMHEKLSALELAQEMLDGLAKGLSRLLCFMRCHDWRDMNGCCRACGEHDPFQFEDRNDD